MPLISWGLSRYPYYSRTTCCEIVCNHLSVLCCCNAGYSDDDEDDDDDNYHRGASKTD